MGTAAALGASKAYYDYIKDMRRLMHQNPELANAEYHTHKLVTAQLGDMGIDFVSAKTGVIARINKGFDRTVAFRADMDALPIQETGSCEYRSQNLGVMHACGHDGHTALLLGFAKYCADNPDKLGCNIVLIFQPAEESTGGAESMIARGALEGVDEIYAIHVDPALKAGVFASVGGPAMAGACEFDLEFYGQSSHCAQKEQGADALAACIDALTGIRESMPPHLRQKAIFHAGAIDGGYARNVVADFCRAQCTVRYFEKKHLDELMSLVDFNLKYAGGNHGVRTVKKVLTQYIPVVNSWACVKKIEDAMPGFIRAEKKYTAEDFAFYLQKVKGCLIWLGVNSGEQPPKRLHAPDFDFEETALLYGLELYIWLTVMGE